MDSEMAIQDLFRRLNNTLRPGKISAVNHDKARVRVRVGPDLETAWLPYFARRAGNTIDWDPPEVGEQCLVLAPGGELSGGFVLTGLYSSAHPAPSQDPGLVLRKFPDGLELSYDHKAFTLTIARPQDLMVVVKGTSMEIQADRFEIISRTKVKLIKTLSDALKSIAGSKTATPNGPQPLLPAATELGAMVQSIDSFGAAP